MVLLMPPILMIAASAISVGIVNRPRPLLLLTIILLIER